STTMRGILWKWYSVLIDRCRFAVPDVQGKELIHQCVADGWEDDKIHVCTKEECEGCGRFDSKYIEYPLTVSGIENAPVDTTGLGHECGCLVEIRPCREEYGGKSYIGIYLGDLPIRIMSSFDRRTGVLKNSALTNPAIFVPELRKIIYGCESWWHEIKSMENFEGISEEDIENTWYVQLLRAMGGNVSDDGIREEND
ncbi:MAG: hypothetical protein ACI4FX_05270, partial [Agathobacter sp.]